MPIPPFGSPAAFRRTTFANLPSAATAGTQLFFVTDIGSSGTFFSSTGSIWRPVGGSCVIGGSSSPSSVTGTATETALGTLTIPAGLITASGSVEITTLWTSTNSANNKQYLIRYSGVAGTPYANFTNTTSINFQLLTIISNANSTGSQIGQPSSSLTYATTSSAQATSSVDTTAATTVSINGKLTNTGETITLSRWVAKLVIP